RIDQEPRGVAHVLLEALPPQFVAELCRAAVLPHDRRVDGAKRFALPEQRGLALVRDADRGQITRADATLFERLGARVEERDPPVARVVLHPSGPRERLRELTVALGTYVAGLVDQQRRHAGRARVDAEDVRHLGAEVTGGRGRLR